MLLFLDVISPLPEFFLIEDNKVIFNRKIIENTSEKLSDNILETYIQIDKDLNLSKNLKKTSITIGPGSYTSLRVGAAFISGLYISKNLLFSPFFIHDLIKLETSTNSIEKTAIYLSSGNNQKYICILKKNMQSKYFKAEENVNPILSTIETIFYNTEKIDLSSNKFNQFKFSIIDVFIKNINNLSFKKNLIIRPIYVSNNKILN